MCATVHVYKALQEIGLFERHQPSVKYAFNVHEADVSHQCCKNDPVAIKLSEFSSSSLRTCIC